MADNPWEPDSTSEEVIIPERIVSSTEVQNPWEDAPFSDEADETVEAPFEVPTVDYSAPLSQTIYNIMRDFPDQAVKIIPNFIKQIPELPGAIKAIPGLLDELALVYGNVQSAPTGGYSKELNLPMLDSIFEESKRKFKSEDEFRAWMEQNFASIMLDVSEFAIPGGKAIGMAGDALQGSAIAKRVNMLDGIDTPNMRQLEGGPESIVPQRPDIPDEPKKEFVPATPAQLMEDPNTLGTWEDVHKLELEDIDPDSPTDVIDEMDGKSTTELDIDDDTDVTDLPPVDSYDDLLEGTHSVVAPEEAPYTWLTQYLSNDGKLADLDEEALNLLASGVEKRAESVSGIAMGLPIEQRPVSVGGREVTLGLIQRYASRARDYSLANKRKLSEDADLILNKGEVLTPALESASIPLFRTQQPNVDPNTLQRLSKSLTDVGLQADPFVWTQKGMAALSKVIPDRKVRKWYLSATMIRNAAPNEAAIDVIDVALANKVTSSMKSYERVKSTMIDIEDKLAKAASKGGKPLSIKDLTKLDSAIRADLKHYPDAQLHIEALDKIKENILKQYEKQKIMSPKEALEFHDKWTTRYKKLLTKSYENLKPTEKYRLAIMQGAEAHLSEIFPEIKQLPGYRSELKVLKEELWKAVDNVRLSDLDRIENARDHFMKEPYLMAKRGASYLSAGLLNTRNVRGRLAIIANKLQKEGATIRPTSAFIRLGFLSETAANYIDDSEYSKERYKMFREGRR